MRNTDHTSSQEETEETEEEEEKEKVKGQGGQATTLKSNNPHLTGGEQHLLCVVSYFMFFFAISPLLPTLRWDYR